MYKNGCNVMDNIQTEDLLSEAEIDVCSIDVEDAEPSDPLLAASSLSVLYGHSNGNKDVERVNGIHKSCYSFSEVENTPDTKAVDTKAVDIGVMGSIGKICDIVHNSNVRDNVLQTLNSDVSSPLTDHDYPLVHNQEVLQERDLNRPGDDQVNIEKPESFTEIISKDINGKESHRKHHTSSLCLTNNIKPASNNIEMFALNSMNNDALFEQTYASDELQQLSKISVPLIEQTCSSIGDGPDYKCTPEKPFNAHTVNRSCNNEGRNVKRHREASTCGSNSTHNDYYIGEDCHSSNAGRQQNRFYFESDHLALKHNKDYQTLLKTLVILESQREKAIRDLDELEKWKEKALSDPIEFVESLQSRKQTNMPQRQTIVKLPHIDWTQYLANCTGSSQHEAYVSTRGSLSKLGHSMYDVELESETSDRGSQFAPSAKYVRGRMLLDTKPATFNQLWTTEEQEKLEKLLHVYPPEEVESRRWEKIARALGNRTSKQVASRVQKYFIKLAKAGLPVPGRAPSLQRKAKVNPVKFRNSTFFPSWRPVMSMPDDEDDYSLDSAENGSLENTTFMSNDLSDDDEIPEHLRESEEYKEYIRLIKLRKRKQNESVYNPCAVHHGYSCDKCGLEPIIGTRYHCMECKHDDVDLCSSCCRLSCSFRNHVPEHELRPVKQAESTFIDGDYVKFSQQHGKYNYLDPNFGSLSS